MLTKKQIQGFKILNNIVCTEFPYIKKVEPVLSEIDRYQFSLNVLVHVDVFEVKDTLNLEFRSDLSDKKNENLVEYILSMNDWGYNYLFTIFDKKFEEKTNRNFNIKIETFMNRVYHQLPKDMVVLEDYESLLKIKEPKDLEIKTLIFVVKK